MTTRATLQAHRYAHKGLLAIDPSALFEVFVMSGELPLNEERPEATLVTIRGPLDQHASRWCDSYEAITARIAQACEGNASAIVMRIDSPGGEAAGCMEAARDIRAMCAAVNKTLIAYVEGKAASAGYALASAASEIILSDTGIVGSIGILSTRTDFSAANAASGMRVEFIASGARKAFGNPDMPITEAELVDQQKLVDSLATVFFDLVADMRGVSPDAISKLEAGVFHGASALDAGLADAAGLPLKQVLANLASTKGSTAMALTAKAEDKKQSDESPFDAARAALKSLAGGNDANAKRAKLALAALEAEGEDGGGEKDDDETKPTKPDESAEGDEKKPDAEGDEKKPDAEGDDKKTEARALRLALQASTEVATLRAELKSERERNERAELLAAHGDLPEPMLTLLAKSPLALVRETLAGIGGGGAPPAPAPKPGVSARAALAALQAGVKPELGNGSGNGVSRLPPAERRELDRMCGLVASTTAVESSEFKLTLGRVVDAPDAPPAPLTPEKKTA